MARDKEYKKIEEADLAEYLDSNSDFGFELLVLRAFKELGFQCEHGGTYQDPVTGKPRQFDIRASRISGDLTLHLSVECKRLKDTYPLLVLAVPREYSESYTEILVPRYRPNPPVGGMENQTSVFLERVLYFSRDYVGKSTYQVRKTTDGQFSSEDKEVYDKWSQAVASAHALVDSVHNICRGPEREKKGLFAVVPVLVIPDGTLWVAEFQPKTCYERKSLSQTSRCEFFLGHPTRLGSDLSGGSYTISHLEIATLGGLKDLAYHLERLEFLREQEVRQKLAQGESR